MAVSLLIAAVLLLPLAPTHEAHAGSVAPEGAGLVDPATGEWHLRGPDGFTTSFYYGDPGDFPIMGDWNCDDIDTPGLYRQSDGYVYLRNSNTQGIADIRFYFGNPGDIPLAGDFNGDGCDTVSIYRRTEGRVYIINELGKNDEGLGAADYAYYFGNPGDKPFTGDFDGDGIDTVGLHRESTGLVYFRNSNTQGIADVAFIFGDPGDRMIAGDWTDDGTDTVGLFRPSDYTIYLRYANTQGNADEQFEYGIPRMLPVSGNFGIPATKVTDRNWTVSTVDAPIEWGRFASLGFGADGRAVVSHGSKTGWSTYQLALTECSDQACSESSTTLEPWNVSDDTSMSADRGRLPIWAFHESDGGRLMVGHCDNEACSTKTYSVVDPVDRSDPVEPGQPTSSGVLSSMAPAADGNPSILYNNTEYRRGLWLARCDNGVCSSAQRSLIRSHTSFHRFDLALGTDNQPFMAVFDWSPSGTFRITAVHCDDAACSLGSESVIQAWPLGFDGWGFPSVVIGSDGLPLIAYNEIHMGEGPDPVRIEALHAAHCDDIRCDTWTSTTISKERIDFVSADTGGDGLPFIAYRTDGALKVAHCKDIACMSSEIVTVDPGPSVGSFTSLATDPFGMPTIAYFDEANHDLKVARLGP